MASRRGSLADPGANCSIYRSVKGSPEFPRALFQKSREVIERQGRPHLASIYRQAAADLGRPPPDLISSDLAGPRNHLRKWS
jgi:hypothetical protein